MSNPHVIIEISLTEQPQPTHIPMPIGTSEGAINLADYRRDTASNIQPNNYQVGNVGNGTGAGSSGAAKGIGQETNSFCEGFGYAINQHNPYHCQAAYVYPSSATNYNEWAYPKEIEHLDSYHRCCKQCGDQIQLFKDAASKYHHKMAGEKSD